MVQEHPSLIPVQSLYLKVCVIYKLPFYYTVMFNKTRTLTKSERGPPRVYHYDTYFLGDDLDL